MAELDHASKVARVDDTAAPPADEADAESEAEELQVDEGDPPPEIVGLQFLATVFRPFCRRVLNRDASVPLTFVVFDVLRRDGIDLTGRP
jgi:ATP-dependent DNA ligase